MKMRKPDSEIYLRVLQEQQLKPEQTLFIDDNQGNIDGAANLGIQTLHLKDPEQLIPFFNGSH
jgi:HAD superfamily hydrolase (TIGR01509 family)